MRRRNLLCAKRNLRGVLCAAKERYNWLSLIMNAEIRLWLFGQHRVASLGRVELLQRTVFSEMVELFELHWSNILGHIQG